MDGVMFDVGLIAIVSLCLCLLLGLSCVWCGP